jgi:hypothetical protein
MWLKREIEFEIGDTVYLVTDGEQHERLVVRIFFSASHVVYELVCGTATSEHYAIEMTLDKKY